MSKPDIVRAVEDKIMGWSLIRRGVIVKPRDSPMRLIQISQILHREAIKFRGYINLSDFTDMWIEAISHSLKDDDFNFSRVFIELMALEVALRWRGFLNKKATFISNPRLRELGRRIPSLKVKGRLVEKLNQNTELLNQINVIKPKKIEAKLIYSLFYPGGIPPSERKNDLQILLKYVQDPDEIVWEIVAITPLLRWDQTINKPKAAGLIDVMNTIAKNIVEVSRHRIFSSIACDHKTSART